VSGEGLIAPYKRFRKTRFYESTFIGGSFSADIIGCPWTCDHCWSHFGWMHEDAEPTFELDPAQVAEKLIAGMERNGQQAARITGGEPFMYVDHMMGVIDEWLARVVGRRMRIKGETTSEGEPMTLVIETNGSLGTLKRLDDVQRRYGADCFHVLLHFGIKATDPEKLSRLNGMAPESAKAAHNRQLRALEHVAAKTDLDLHVSVFDAFSDEEGVERLEALLERARPGSAMHMVVAEFNRRYGAASKFHTPKRHRE
jgi:uncharacterized Fe-S cluster-containing radical SAM superfamily protein